MEEKPATARKRSMNKTEIIAALCEATGQSKQQVSGLFDELTTLIGKNLGEDGPGIFAVPGLLQIKVVRKPATVERKGINPFTKEEMIIKAKPATNVVKLMPLKGLKAMVQAISPEGTKMLDEELQADQDDSKNMIVEGGESF
jgi:nucleoid DNA-binding protein